MNQRLDDATLAAYVDGELDPDQLREIEQAVARDPDARRKVRRMREVGALMRSACSEASFQNVPDALIQLARPCCRKPWRVWIPRALAASILLASFIGIDFVVDTHWKKPEIGTVELREAMLDEIAAYHLVYAREREHLVEVPASRQPHIEQWLGSRLNRKLSVPDLSSLGMRFEGARLLVLGGHPVAQLVYSRDRAEPVAVCVTFGEIQKVPMEITQHRGINVAYWNEDGYAYVVVGALTEDAIQHMVVKVDNSLGGA